MLWSLRTRSKLALIIVPRTPLGAVVAPVAEKSIDPASLLDTLNAANPLCDGARPPIDVARATMADMDTRMIVRRVIVRVSAAVDMIIESQLFIHMRWITVQV